MSVVTVARSVLDKYWDRTLPVDILFIAKQMGVVIKEAILIDNQQSISGKLSFENGVPVCTVNIQETEQRQRFTIAHELGHYFLGHGEQFDTSESLYPNTNGWQSSIEAETKAFAVEVLMPKIAVDFLIQNNGVTDINELAYDLNVPPILMQYRLKTLNWI